MPGIPYAFSVHHFVSSVGSYAGFAAILGLAVLILLYFAQAREAATLRARLADLTEQLAHLEPRLMQMTRAARAQSGAGRAAPAAPPALARAGTGAPVVSRRPAFAGFRGAPAGVGAPALADATRLIPDPVPAADAGAEREPVEIGAGVGLATAAAAGAGALVGTAAGGGGRAGAGNRFGPAERPGLGERPGVRERPGAGAALAEPPGPPPATAAGANGMGVGPRAAGGGPSGGQQAGGPSGGQQAGGPPTGTQPGGGGARPVMAGPPPQPSPRAHARADAAGNGRSLPPRYRLVRHRSPWARGGLALAAVLAVALVVVIVAILTSSGSSSPSSNASGGGGSQGTAATARHGRGRRHVQPVVVNPAKVTVEVLNGTTVNGLAGSISSQLKGKGFKTGNPTNAANQAQATTTVGYQPGHRDAALLVAKELGLPSSDVAPAGAEAINAACPASAGPCTVTVIVTAGSDLTGSSSATTTT